MAVQLNVKNFGYFAFNSSSPLLSDKDQKTALALTVLMGICTFGIGHLISGITYAILKPQMNVLLTEVDRLAQTTIGSNSSNKSPRREKPHLENPMKSESLPESKSIDGDGKLIASRNRSISLKEDPKICQEMIGLTHPEDVKSFFIQLTNVSLDDFKNFYNWNGKDYIWKDENRKKDLREIAGYASQEIFQCVLESLCSDEGRTFLNENQHLTLLENLLCARLRVATKIYVRLTSFDSEKEHKSQAAEISYTKSQTYMEDTLEIVQDLLQRYKQGVEIGKLCPFTILNFTGIEWANNVNTYVDSLLLKKDLAQSTLNKLENLVKFLDDEYWYDQDIYVALIIKEGKLWQLYMDQLAMKKIATLYLGTQDQESSLGLPLVNSTNSAGGLPPELLAIIGSKLRDLQSLNLTSSQFWA